MVEHLKAHTQEKPFSCDKCHKSFKSRHSLREHVLRHHDKVQKWVCMYSGSTTGTAISSENNICNERFSSRHLLMRHRKYHDSTLCFACKICGHEFATKRGLQLHNPSHTGKYEFTCISCDRGFSTKILLDEHTLIHSGEKPISCDKCDKKFSNRGTFWTHRKIHELGARPFVCDVCSRSYNHRSHLSAHKRKHTGERPYKCWLCCKEFALVSHLKRHMATHDNNPRPFCCSVCYTASNPQHGDIPNFEVTFDKRVDLVHHYRKCHGGVVIQDCPPNLIIEQNDTKTKTETTATNEDTRVRLPSLFNTTMNYSIATEHELHKTQLVSHPAKVSHQELPSIMTVSHDGTLNSSNIFLTQFACELCHVEFQDCISLENHLIMKHARAPIYATHKVVHEDNTIDTTQVSTMSCHLPKPDEISVYQQLNVGSKQNETLLIVMPDTFSQQ